jgi:hypothetical protein
LLWRLGGRRLEFSLAAAQVNERLTILRVVWISIYYLPEVIARLARLIQFVKASPHPKMNIPGKRLAGILIAGKR